MPQQSQRRNGIILWVPTQSERNSATNPHYHTIMNMHCIQPPALHPPAAVGVLLYRRLLIQDWHVRLQAALGVRFRTRR